MKRAKTKAELEADNFKCTFYEPNILLITWFPENE